MRLQGGYFGLSFSWPARPRCEERSSFNAGKRSPQSGAWWGKIPRAHVGKFKHCCDPKIAVKQLSGFLNDRILSICLRSA